jgi:hypothetical protein
MPIDYNKMAAVATRLLSPPPKGNGMPIALRRKVPGTYDPETGKISGETTVNLPAIGLWQARSADYQVVGRGVGGVVKVSDIESEDRQMIIAAVNPDGSIVVPQLDDKVVVEGQAWQILSEPKIVKPTTVAIGYVLLMRK